jgi:hypothetical protein
MSLEKDYFPYPWVKGIWSEWSVKNGVGMRHISPVDSTVLMEMNIHKSLHLSKIDKEVLEYQFSLTVADFLKEHEGRMPTWGRIFRNRSGNGYLTPWRDKNLTGYIIQKPDDDLYRDKVHEFFDSAGYIITPKNDASYQKLFDSGVSCVEKELLRSRKKRLLVFRFLNSQGKVIRLSSLRWEKNDPDKKVRGEQQDIEGKWSVVGTTITDLEEGSKELDRFILSL